MKCQYCGKELILTKEQIKHGVRFCNKSCSAFWRNTVYGVPPKSPEKLKEASKRLTEYNLKNKEKISERMKKNNPVHQPGVIEKIKQTKLKNGTVFFNNYKYGNGKISKYEKIVYDFLIENGFYYNYAINTRDVRNAFLNKQYAKSYKPDFVNLQRKICIEIDGKNHQKKEIIKLDIKKEECLLFLGYKTIRYTHDFIEKNFNQFKLEVLNLCGLEN